MMKMMMKKKTMLSVVSALMLGSMTTAFAAQSPFADVPSDHWSRDAVAELAKDGVLHGYPDSTFQGDKKITRFEMAKMVARAMANEEQAKAEDRAALDKLQAEYAGELRTLGVRVAELEKKMDDNVRISGCVDFKYMKSDKYNQPDGDTDGPWWEKYFKLGVDAKINDSWKAHTEIETKYGSGKGDGFNAETPQNQGTVSQMWVEGPLGGVLSGQYTRIGCFEPWIQDGAFMKARMKGFELTHWGRNYTTHMLYGRIDNTQWDLCPGRSDARYSDFIRKYDRNTAEANHDYGGDNATDVWGSQVEDTMKTYAGFIYDHQFSSKAGASIGYNRYLSHAYGGSPLNIVSFGYNQHLTKTLWFDGVYGHGNQGGQNNTYSMELDYKNVDGQKPHSFMLYAAYRCLGSDAIAKTNYGDGIQAGQKGWEIGGQFTFMKNVIGTLKYAKGIRLYDSAERSRIYSCVDYSF